MRHSVDTPIVDDRVGPQVALARANARPISGQAVFQPIT